MTATPAAGSSHTRDAAAEAHHHRGKTSEGRLDQAAVLAALDLQPAMTVLDAGCGNGYMAKAFAAAVGDAGLVYALDPDDAVIATLQRETAGGNVQAFVGDITTTTQLAPATVDLVYVGLVLHGFTRAQMHAFGVEVDHILRPDGRLAIVEIDKRDTPFGPPQELRLTPEELQRRVPLTPLATVRAGEYYYLQLFAKPV